MTIIFHKIFRPRIIYLHRFWQKHHQMLHIVSLRSICPLEDEWNILFSKNWVAFEKIRSFWGKIPPCCTAPPPNRKQTLPLTPEAPHDHSGVSKTLIRQECKFVEMILHYELGTDTEPKHTHQAHRQSPKTKILTKIFFLSFILYPSFIILQKFLSLVGIKSGQIYQPILEQHSEGFAESRIIAHIRKP